MKRYFVFQITKKIPAIPQIWTVLLLLFLMVSILTLGCSRSARHSMLDFFFDGVPPLEDAENVTASDSLDQTNLTSTIPSDSTISKIPQWTFHPKLESNECMTCHDQEQSFRLFDEPESLCVSCHDQADAAVVHAPVEAGTCTDCHNPHGSKNLYLLIETKDKLCFQCHDEEEVKPSGAEYIHEPVEAGACTDCHNPHSTTNPYMLVESGQALCFKCHDAAKITSIETHEGIEEMACYECHDPHNAENQYFIK